MLDDAEIARRKPVWTALSDLWLDTEMTDAWLSRMAKIMHERRYSLDELRHIYLYEVAPVVYGNLLSVAGEWSGIDEAWLHDRIMDSLRRRGLGPKAHLSRRRRAQLRQYRRLYALVALVPRWLRRSRLRSRHRLMTCATEEEWRSLAAKVAALRGAATGNGERPPDA